MGEVASILSAICMAGIIAVNNSSVFSTFQLNLTNYGISTFKFLFFFNPCPACWKRACTHRDNQD